jgi:parvulin-like peptidyl-prolyl cis-trans isomerase-like protein
MRTNILVAPRTDATHRCRVASALACVLLACASLSACGSGSTKPENKAESSSSTQSDFAAGSAVNARASVGVGRSSPSEGAVRAVAATVPSSAPGPDSGMVIANVDGLKITLGELRHRMGTMKVSKQEVPEPPGFAACVAHEATTSSNKNPVELKKSCESRYESLKREALNSLIHARWFTLEAKHRGLHVSEAALDEETTRGLKVAAKVGQTLALTGQTIADAKYWGRIAQFGFLLNARIKRLIPKVTPRRIAAYYARHKASFASPETRDLHLIRTDSLASARQALREIRDGRSFQSVVKEVSTHQPIHSSEGSVEGLTYNDYSEPHLSNAIFKARPHQLEGPVKLDASDSPKIAFGYYVFEVLRIHPPRQRSFAEVKAGIAARLPEVLRLATLKAVVTTFKHTWRSRTDCRAGYVVEDCRQYTGTPAFEDPYEF